MKNPHQKLLEDIKEGKIKFDWSGHRRKGVTQPSLSLEVEKLSEQRERFWGEVRVLENIGFMVLINSRHDQPDLIIGAEEGYRADVCFDCGQELFMKLEGDTLKASAPCPYPNGHPEYGGEIKFPSGVIIFADEMFRSRPEELEPSGCAKGVLWEKSATMSSLSINVGHGICGNSCPSVFVSKDKKEILIASPAYDRETYEDLPSFPNHDRVGSICTDLWWWTACDREIASEISANGAVEFDVDCEAEVLPGVWEVKQRYHLEDRDNSTTPTIYAKLVWIKEIES